MDNQSKNNQQVQKSSIKINQKFINLIQELQQNENSQQTLYEIKYLIIQNYHILTNITQVKSLIDKYFLFKCYDILRKTNDNKTVNVSQILYKFIQNNTFRQVLIQKGMIGLAIRKIQRFDEIIPQVTYNMLLILLFLCDYGEYRNAIIQQNGLQILLKIIFESPNDQFSHPSLQCIIKIFNNCSLRKFPYIRQVSHIITAIFISDNFLQNRQDFIKSIFQSIYNLIQKNMIDKSNEMNIMSRLMEYSLNKKFNISKASLITLKQFAYNKLERLKMIIDCGYLSQVHNFLASSHQSVKKTTCLLLLNIAQIASHQSIFLNRKQLLNALQKQLAENDITIKILICRIFIMLHRYNKPQPQLQSQYIKINLVGIAKQFIQNSQQQKIKTFGLTLLDKLFIFGDTNQINMKNLLYNKFIQLDGKKLICSLLTSPSYQVSHLSLQIVRNHFIFVSTPEWRTYI